ncbi:cytochrome b/b6 domain-containing protein [Candidatus Marinarcus aquaticus]|uniref:Cytochrome B n=1 Tax=Candidatus Marinarcus aquaticus TaxID=2044504 RepID=A0A4Q0XR70_9BACT|nr:cytochrome b/b6 domain-containing protein [Candidatus Marinarcus aquaticus]RXJ58138.1 cytochrome B [Candidatus Marinarcus aquaticus]
MMKSYIWSLPTRVFHWLFALLILLAFLTDDDHLLDYHAVIGYSLLIILLFRLVWGIVGPKYSKFKDFNLSKEALKKFVKNPIKADHSNAGHNPAASYLMITMIVVAILVIATGALAFGIQEGKGIFSFLNDSFFKKMKLFKEIHETLANFFIFLIVVHLGGVIMDKLFHPQYETLKSIFTGYKHLDEDKSIKTTIFQKAVAFIFLIALVAFLVYNLINPKNVLIASSYEPVDYSKQNEVFVSECGSCHTLYPSQSIA